MQITSYIISFALILLGGDWVLQWLGIIPGTMVGDNRWGVFGAVFIIVGLFLMLGAGRRSSA